MEPSLEALSQVRSWVGCREGNRWKKIHQFFSFLCCLLLTSNHRIYLWLLLCINCLGSSGPSCSEHRTASFLPSGNFWAQRLASASSLIGAKQRAALAALWAASQPADAAAWLMACHTARLGPRPQFHQRSSLRHVFWLLFMRRSVLAHESQSSHAGKNI